jgi:hypothetical protein
VSVILMPLRRCLVLSLLPLWGPAGAGSARAQISPSEIKHPRPKSLEQTYLPKLVALNHDIGETKFPFPFALSRYIGLDSKNPLGADRRGLEFVIFHGRTILKVSGNYSAAFNSAQLTQNQRANRVLDEVIVPILRLLPDYFPEPLSFDGVGFEVSYHVRAKERSYDYEGAEVLTVVFAKADAFRYLAAHEDSGRQEVLDVSEVYLNGKEFGLALNARDPFDVEALPKPR